MRLQCGLAIFIICGVKVASDSSLLANVKDRSELAGICEKLKLSVGVELGVKYAEFAEHNLQVWKSCKRYILVDIWNHLDNYVDSANVLDTEQEKIFQAAQARLIEFKNKTIFMRNLTVEAAAHVTNSSVDFVYVDARHDYCGCLDDMEAWWPKLR